MKTLPIVKTDIQLRYSDIDMLGHVSNNKYGEFLEMGRIQWSQSIPGNEQTASVVVNLNINYRGEIKFSDTVYVKTWCTKVGTTSVNLIQEVYANDRCVNSTTAVLVGFDTTTRKSVPFLTGWLPSEVDTENA